MIVSYSHLSIYPTPSPSLAQTARGLGWNLSCHGTKSPPIRTAAMSDEWPNDRRIQIAHAGILKMD